jgi:hypothetical protein
MTTIRRRPDIVQKHTTSIHEAGHACAAVALGLRFKTVDIIAGKGRRGRIIWPRDWLRDPWRLLQDEGNNQNPRIVDLAKRRIAVTFAGSAAQRRVVAGATDLWWDAYSDRAVADRWLQRLIAGPPDYGPKWELDRYATWYPPERFLSNNTLDDHHSRYRARAAALIARLWPQIERVAAELIRRKVLSFDEVRRLMNHSARRIPRTQRRR